MEEAKEIPKDWLHIQLPNNYVTIFIYIIFILFNFTIWLEVFDFLITLKKTSFTESI